MSTHVWKLGNCLDYMRTYQDGAFDFVIGDPPYEDPHLIVQVSLAARRVSRGAVVLFMYPEDTLCLNRKCRPDQICHWVKPVSTKNTKRKYSRFVEAICVWHGPFFNSDLHWSNRTGIFTDALIKEPNHPHKKPEALIERLIRLHMPIKSGAKVLDCFGGSGTVQKVCKRLGVNSVSIDVDEKWNRCQ